jgi:hypothetical protein
MATGRRLTPEERALILAQTKQIGEQSALAQQELLQKARIAQEQLSAERDINASKLGLGREEIGSKEKLGQLAAALEALGQASKADIAEQSERGAVASELTRRGDIPQDVLASALAESGQPGLYNALSRKKFEDREKAITTSIPLLQAARSDEEREKKIRPSLEALGTGTYQEALARAYPKPGQAVPTATPARFEGGPTPTRRGPDLAGLAATLLGNAGVGEKPGAAASPTVAPEVNYTGLGRGSLEGSKFTDVGGGRGQLATPSSGTIGFNLPRTEEGVLRLGALIRPQTVAPPTEATRFTQVPAPAGAGELVSPPPVPNIPIVTPTANEPHTGLRLGDLVPGNVVPPTVTPQSVGEFAGQQVGGFARDMAKIPGWAGVAANLVAQPFREYGTGFQAGYKRRRGY